jgi:outer membrane cobalamin receptor
VSGYNCGSGKDGSEGLPDMTTSKIVFCTLVFFTGSIFEARATELKGVVQDPTGKGIPGAQVAACNPVGVITQQVTDDRGIFDLYISPLYESVQLRAAAEGFATATVSAATAVIRLTLAPQSESVAVTASAIDTLPSQQGTQVSVITSADLRERNEAQALDVLRTLPGMVFAQDGARGSVADLFVRGGNSNANLVLLDGVAINSFYYGGLFDFAHIPVDAIEQVQVARGPQSAIYGSYALGSVVSFETRSPENGPALDVVAEGGTHDENHFSISGETMLTKGWGISGSFSSLLGNGPVQNSDYRNDNGLLALDHRWHTQKISIFGDFDSNDVGEPGPYGSNPVGNFPGLDLISRSKNNTSTYGLHYSNDLTSNLKIDLIGGIFWNNSLYISPYGPSFNKDLSGSAEARATYVISKVWTIAGGFVFHREEMRNTYVNTTDGSDFLLRRDDISEYLENRFNFGKLFVNIGLRYETYSMPFVPGDAFGFPARPDFPARTDSEISPKMSAAYMIKPGTRIHASYGTGIRPPGGSDLAFTNNPALVPEHTQSYDVGAEQYFLGNKLSLDATWFHNRYQDLIVSLGGSLSELLAFSTGNLSNARAEGLENTAQFRPTSWLSMNASYTWLESEVLQLTGSTGLVQQYFHLGEPLLRRPKQSGSFVVSVRHGRADANLVGSWRGHTLDVEPNFGASAGLFVSPGYQNLGVNLNVRVRGNLTAYVNLHNALDQRYEEIYGFPAPFLNVVTGLKWNLARAR